MDPNTLAQQQLFTAWLSAGAAAVQAIGAVVAIFWSIKIARDAANREREAEAASVARAESAERIAAEREQKAAIAAFNGPLDAILGLLQPAVRDVDEEVARIHSSFADTQGHIRGGLDVPSLVKVRHAVARAEQQMSDPDVLLGLSELAGLLEPWTTESLPASKYVAEADAFAERLKQAQKRTADLRR